LTATAIRHQRPATADIVSSDRTLRSLIASTTQRHDLSDSTLFGFGVRLSSRGHCFLRVRYRVNGPLRRFYNRSVSAREPGHVVDLSETIHPRGQLGRRRFVIRRDALGGAVRYCTHQTYWSVAAGQSLPEMALVAPGKTGRLPFPDDAPAAGLPSAEAHGEGESNQALRPRNAPHGRHDRGGSRRNRVVRYSAGLADP